MFEKDSFEFLKALKENNDREWFAENKSRYERAKSNVESMIAEMIPAMASFDSGIGNLDPKKCLFRIYRDTRFSQDKTPYKANFGIIFRPDFPQGKYSGYYMHIDPDGCFISSGLYMLPPAALKTVRKVVYDEFDELLSILNEKEFKKRFEGIRFDESEMLKRVPNEFDKTSPAAEYMKLKHFYVTRSLSERELFSPTIVKDVVSEYELMYPFSRFMNRILKDT